MYDCMLELFQLDLLITYVKNKKKNYSFLVVQTLKIITKFY